jgi:ABC-type oligopeptide transport system substrate-binding subunit
VPPGCGEYGPPQSLPYDPETAARLMVEAGFPGGRGLRPLEVGFSVTSALEQTVLEAIQQMWRKHLGVEVTLTRGEEKVLQDALQHQQFDLMMGMWIGDYLDPTTFLDLMQSANGNNHGKWANATYDGLLEQATRTMEVKRRYDLLRRAEELMLVEAPMIPLFYFPQRELRQPMVKGWHNNVLGRHPLNFVYLNR